MTLDSISSWTAASSGSVWEPAEADEAPAAAVAPEAAPTAAVAATLAALFCSADDGADGPGGLRGEALVLAAPLLPAGIRSPLAPLG